MKNYKIVDEMPEEGDFVGLWTHNGRGWSTNYRILDGDLLAYSEYFEEYYKVKLPCNATAMQFVVEDTD